MSNGLDQTTQQQILALGRLGWSLRRIEQALSVRRETVSGYLKAAGIPVHGRGRHSESKPKPAISDTVSTDSGAANPATKAEVSTDQAAVPRPGRAPSSSARAVSRADRAGTRARAQRDGDLAGPRRPDWWLARAWSISKNHCDVLGNVRWRRDRVHQTVLAVLDRARAGCPCVPPENVQNVRKVSRAGTPKC
jgi:hypothetical protein